MTKRTDLVLVPKPSTAAARAAELQRQAQEAAAEHTHEMLDAFATAERLAREVADGGSLYPHGIRDIARRTAETLNANTATIWKIGNGT